MPSPAPLASSPGLRAFRVGAFVDMIDPDGDRGDEVGTIGLGRSLAWKAARGAERKARKFSREARRKARSSAVSKTVVFRGAP